MAERRNGDSIQTGDITGAGIAVGRNAQATATGNVITTAGAQLDPAEVRAALTELRRALAQAALPDDAQLRAETAAGNAIVEGVKQDEVEAESVATRVKEIGDALKEANVVVEQGSDLWASIEKVARVVGPVVVGGARVVAAWFGVPLPL